MRDQLTEQDLQRPVWDHMEQRHEKYWQKEKTDHCTGSEKKLPACLLRFFVKIDHTELLSAILYTGTFIFHSQF